MASSNYSLVEIENMDDKSLKSLFGGMTKSRDMIYEYPDYEKLAKELLKPKVTTQLLWEEYCVECRLSRKLPYRLTQFRKYFYDYLRKNRFTDIIRHRPGEKIEVDWAGAKPKWKDPDTGETIYGNLFVGVLPFSGYGYAYAFGDMKQASWIQGHINMFEYFKGASKILVSDNLKTGVTKNKKDEVILNRMYEDMATYYGAVVIPTRVKRPKDKATVENLVNQLTNNIIARLRNYQVFTIEEYNQLLEKALDEFNRKPFQKKEGSRYSVFHEMEKDSMIPLPKTPYSICTWKKAKVANNSHISLNKCYYSVPHQHIGETVDVKIGKDELEIFLNQIKLCSHKLIKDKIGKYSSDVSHMPVNSNAYSEWNSERYLNWAKTKGPFTHQVVRLHFESVKVEQQKYRMVHSIIKLADKYGTNRLELACQYALRQIRCPNYKNIKMILDNKQDMNVDKDDLQNEFAQSKFLRGAKYYE